ncbi:DUF2793 domain-containing protein [Pseudomonas citronellolis]|uniref:DUF2793 domain-containing protein n=1 Tax=Pseudomonas citronellolis TaxID=53408 RepID=UPI002FDB7E55
MTNKLALTDLANGQANYLNANATFAQLNQLVQAGVVDKDLATPPGSPADEALYIVAASPTGLWSGQAGKLAYWLSAAGAWTFITPREGFLVHVNDEDTYYKYDGSSWAVFSSGGGGMTNPMTTAGDLIVGGASGAPTRLAKGADGQILTMVSGAEAWATPAGSAGGLTLTSKSADYTLVLGDANNGFLHPSADTTARTWTIPANASVAFPVGTAISFVNQNSAGTITIAITTDTMRLVGTGTTGSRTLAANGIATALKITNTEWIISGVNLT